jgi:hypothetical protein
MPDRKTCTNCRYFDIDPSAQPCNHCSMSWAFAPVCRWEPIGTNPITAGTTRLHVAEGFGGQHDGEE